MPLPSSDQPLTPALASPQLAQADGAGGSSLLAGPLGLRAGWGILLYLLLAGTLGVLLFVGLFQATGQFRAFGREGVAARDAAVRARETGQRPVSPPARLSTTFLTETAETGAVLLAGWALSYFERRRFGVYGLPRRTLGEFLPGAVWGLLAIGLLIGLLRGFGFLLFERRLLSGASTLGYGAAWLGVFVLVGVFEEFLFRGYLQFTLMRGLLSLGARLDSAQAQRAAFWIAAVVLSALFSLAHLSNAGEDPVGIAVVFVAGLLFSYALWRTGSLWWAIGFHLSWDWGQSFLFGVPDSGVLSVGRLFATRAQGPALLSGGVDGPEGSLLVLPVLLLVALVIRRHPQAAQPAVEPMTLPPFATDAAPRVIP